ncbi:MAG: hypothetical protein JXR49_19445 [Acidobacteria bacterium]|nr:hypothetical protein [Acidobacteriota bacterium]
MQKSAWGAYGLHVFQRAMGKHTIKYTMPYTYAFVLSHGSLEYMEQRKALPHARLAIIQSE